MCCVLAFIVPMGDMDYVRVGDYEGKSGRHSQKALGELTTEDIQGLDLN